MKVGLRSLNKDFPVSDKQNLKTHYLNTYLLGSKLCTGCLIITVKSYIRFISCIVEVTVTTLALPCLLHISSAVLARLQAVQSGYGSRHICPSARNNAAHSGWILFKYIGGFY
jgi:hypothetical protein